MDEERKPASEEFRDVIGVLFEGRSRDRRLEAIDREIDALYEKMRDYLEAANELGLVSGLGEAAFDVYVKATSDLRPDALLENEHAQGRKHELEAKVEELRARHADDIRRLAVLQAIREQTTAGGKEPAGGSTLET
jgi:hypothetical protein